METETGCVVDTIIIPVTEVNNSNCMGKEGFVRLLEGLKKEGIKIDIVSTDRHTQIKKLMRVDPNFNDIKHQFDPWHVAKSICKKINKAAKLKSREDLLEWVPSIVNHFWWSVTSSSNKNAHLIYEKIQSCIYHVTNRHEGVVQNIFKKNANMLITHWKRLHRKTGSLRVHRHINFLCHFFKNLKNDIQYSTEAIHTTDVEVFNNLLLKYIPKQYRFQYDHMVMGAYLAALDHNFNAERGYELDSFGEVKYRVA